MRTLPLDNLELGGRRSMHGESVADIGVWMRPEVLAHKLAARHRTKPIEAWNMGRWPSRLSRPGQHRLFVASTGAWRGYFTLCDEALYTAADPSAPFTLLFDARTWTPIDPRPVELPRPGHLQRSRQLIPCAPLTTILKARPDCGPTHHRDRGPPALKSVGANYIEANESLSKRDFVLRAKICRKEAKEARYWLRLVAHGMIRPLPLSEMASFKKRRN